MNVPELKPLQARSLSGSAPWTLMEVNSDGDDRLVAIPVECAAGVMWSELRTFQTGAFAEPVFVLPGRSGMVLPAARGTVCTDDQVDAVMRRTLQRGLRCGRESLSARLGSDKPERSGDRTPPSRAVASMPPCAPDPFSFPVRWTGGSRDFSLAEMPAEPALI